MGTVYDEDIGELLPGVNLYIDNSFPSTTTNIKGEFCIKNVILGKHTLKVSVVGYFIKNIQLNVNKDTIRIDIPLLSELYIYKVSCDTNYYNNINDSVSIKCNKIWLDTNDLEKYFLTNISFINNSNKSIFIPKNNLYNWNVYCAGFYDSEHNSICKCYNGGSYNYTNDPIDIVTDIVEVKKHSILELDSIIISDHIFGFSIDRILDYANYDTLYVKIKYLGYPQYWITHRNEKEELDNFMNEIKVIHCSTYRHTIESDFCKLNCNKIGDK